MVPGFVSCVATDAFGVPRGGADGAACVPSVVTGEEGQLLEGKLESEILQVCWAKG